MLGKRFNGLELMSSANRQSQATRRAGAFVKKSGFLFLRSPSCTGCRFMLIQITCREEFTHTFRSAVG